MDLDDQLSALAAGELDEGDARRLRARVAGDPALRQRLARMRRLDAVLRDWDVPPMDTGQVAALDDVVTAALDELGDGPLAADGGTVVSLHRPLAGDAPERDGGPARGTGQGGAGDEVVDLAAARARREVPRWVTRVMTAAAAVAVVATVGVGLGGVLGGDDSGDESTVLAEDGVEESGAEEGLLEAESAVEDAAADEAGSAEAARADEGIASIQTVLPVVLDELGPLDGPAAATLRGLVPEPMLAQAAALAEERAATPDQRHRDDSALVREAVLGTLPASACLEDLLTALPLDDVLVLAGTGTLDGRPAVATVVVRATDDGPVTSTQVVETTGCAPVTELTEPL